MCTPHLHAHRCMWVRTQQVNPFALKSEAGHIAHGPGTSPPGAPGPQASVLPAWPWGLLQMGPCPWGPTAPLQVEASEPPATTAPRQERRGLRLQDAGACPPAAALLLPSAGGVISPRPPRQLLGECGPHTAACFLPLRIPARTTRAGGSVARPRPPPAPAAIAASEKKVGTKITP